MAGTKKINIAYLFIVIVFFVGCTSTGVQSVPEPPIESNTPPPSQTAVLPTSTPQPETPAPVPSSTPIRLPDRTLPEGLGVSIHYEFFPDTYMPIPEYMLLKEANVRIVRDDLWPGGACGAPPWCFEYFDKLVTDMSLIGVRVVFNIQDYENREIGTEAGRKAFAAFAGAAAKELKGKGVIWELWNEPDLDEYWKPYSNPHEYALLVDETVQAIREADPDAVIVGPSVATLSTVFGDGSWRFLQSIGEEGTLSKFDAIDVHLYNGGSPESQIENLRKLRRLIDSYSPDRKIPITSTEWGYTTGAEFYRHRSNAEEQPKYLVRSFLVKAAHEVNLSVWYDWKNDDWGANDTANRNFGVITSSGEPKPAYTALKTLTTTLDGYQFVRRLAAQSSHDYLLLFRKGDAGVLAAWTIAGTHTVPFPDVSRSIKSISMYGDEETPAVDGQGLSLQLSDAPQYLLLPEGSLGTNNVFWNPNGTFFRLDKTGQGDIPIWIENPSDQEQTFGLEAILKNESVGSTEVSLGPNETQVIHLPLEIKAKPEELDFFIQINLSRDANVQSAWVWAQR